MRQCRFNIASFIEFDVAHAIHQKNSFCTPSEYLTYEHSLSWINTVASLKNVNLQYLIM